MNLVISSENLQTLQTDMRREIMRHLHGSSTRIPESLSEYILVRGMMTEVARDAIMRETVTHRGWFARSLLWRSAIQGGAESIPLMMLDILRDLNYDFRTPSAYRNSVLFDVADHGTVDSMQALLDHGFNIDETLGDCAKYTVGDTPLHCAARNENVDVVRFLVAKGANRELRNNVDAPERYRKTALELAEERMQFHGYSDIV